MMTDNEELIQEVLSALKDETVSTNILQKFRKFAHSGQQKQCIAIIKQFLGKKKCNQLIPKVTEYIKIVPNEPIQGAKLVQNHQISTKGVKAYLYSSKKLSKQEESKSMNVLIVGKTGTGKTTFLNAIVNKYENVKMNDDFRYVLTNVSHTYNQAKSDTSEVTIYNIFNPKLHERALRIIDTPGMGDTQGLKVDQQIPKKIKKVLQSISHVNLIIFMVKSSDNRMDATQKYIFESIWSMFSIDIAANFFFVCSFYDGRNNIWDYLSNQMNQKNQRNIYYDKIVSKIKGEKYCNINNSVLFQTLNQEDDIEKQFWNLGQTSIQTILKKIQTMEPKSINQTVKVLNYKQSLQTKLQNMVVTSDKCLTDQQNLREEIKIIKRYKNEIDQNKDFQYQVPYTKRVEVPIKEGTMTTYCNHCLTTCHQVCKVTNKEKCIAMKGDSCIHCKYKCHYSQHTVYPFTIKYQKSIKMENNDTMKKSFLFNTQGKKNSQILLQKKLRQYYESKSFLIDILDQIMVINQELDELSLLQRKSTTTIEYIQQLISGIQHEKPKDYLQRVGEYQTTIKAIQKINQIKESGNKKFEMDKELKQEIQSVVNVEQIEKNGLYNGLYQKIKGFSK